MVDEVRARALDLAARVARVQTRAKISTLEVARLCGVPSSSLSKLLKGVVADTPAGRANLDSLATWLSRSHDQWVARVAEQERLVPELANRLGALANVAAWRGSALALSPTAWTELDAAVANALAELAPGAVLSSSAVPRSAAAAAAAPAAAAADGAAGTLRRACGRKGMGHSRTVTPDSAEAVWASLAASKWADPLPAVHGFTVSRRDVMERVRAIKERDDLSFTDIALGSGMSSGVLSQVLNDKYKFNSVRSAALIFDWCFDRDRLIAEALRDVPADRLVPRECTSEELRRWLAMDPALGWVGRARCDADVWRLMEEAGKVLPLAHPGVAEENGSEEAAAAEQVDVAAVDGSHAASQVGHSPRKAKEKALKTIADVAGDEQGDDIETGRGKGGDSDGSATVSTEDEDEDEDDEEEDEESEEAEEDQENQEEDDEEEKEEEEEEEEEEEAEEEERKDKQDEDGKGASLVAAAESERPLGSKRPRDIGEKARPAKRRPVFVTPNLRSRTWRPGEGIQQRVAFAKTFILRRQQQATAWPAKPAAVRARIESFTEPLALGALRVCAEQEAPLALEPLCSLPLGATGLIAMNAGSYIVAVSACPAAPHVVAVCTGRPLHGDGKAAIRDREGALQLWDVKSGRLLVRFAHALGPIWDIKWCPAVPPDAQSLGLLAVAAGREGRVAVFDIPAGIEDGSVRPLGAPWRELSLPAATFWRLAWSEGPEWLLGAGALEGIVAVWSLMRATGAAASSASSSSSSSSSSSPSSPSPSTTYLLTCRRVINPASLAVFATIRGLSFDPDNAMRLVVCSHTGELVVLDLSAGGSALLELSPSTLPLTSCQWLAGTNVVAFTADERLERSRLRLVNLGLLSNRRLNDKYTLRVEGGEFYSALATRPVALGGAASHAFITGSANGSAVLFGLPVNSPFLRLRNRKGKKQAQLATAGVSVLRLPDGALSVTLRRADKHRELPLKVLPAAEVADRAKREAVTCVELLPAAPHAVCGTSSGLLLSFSSR